MTSGSEHEARRGVRRIVWKAALYTYGFLAAAFAVALGGAALVAWVLSRGGLPFLETWIAISVIVLLPSLVGMVWRALRERSGKVGSTDAQKDDAGGDTSA